ncbi:NnrS family protein [Methylacidimicrobium cyclopophantes]|nr:NnrS family protein [Methylacidimicrobium cyclopophantes]
MEANTTPELSGPVPPAVFLRLCAREPYRILFPLGTVLGLLGVAVWPLSMLGWAPSPPLQSHPRIMVEGFVGSFVIGFLATSLPRLLEVEPLSGNLVLVLGVTLLSSSIFHLLGWPWAGDMLFTFALVLLLIAFTARGRRRRIPPPSFLLVLLGVAGGAVGAFLQAEQAAGMRTSPLVRQVSLLLVWQGLPLLPVLGVGAFFLPRLYERESPERAVPALAAGWAREAFLAAGAGLLLFASFLLEAEGKGLLGGLLRVCVIASYLWATLPASGALRAKGTVTAAARFAVAFSLLGFFLAALLGTGRAGYLHLFFIGGAGLMILALGVRVVYGFSGRGFLLHFRFIPFELAIAGVAAAVVTRIGADHLPSGRSVLLSVAAVFWIAALALWAFAVLPFVLCPDTEEKKEAEGGRAESALG